MHKLYCPKEDLSVGQLFLLDICDQRKITEFWRNNLEKETDLSKLMKIATGFVQYPTLKLIYCMSKFVFPAKWFYKPEEYEQKYKKMSENTFQFTENFRESINYKIIENMFNEKKLWKYCEDRYGEKSKNKYVILYNFLNGRNKISAKQIKELESDFPVENWFIK